MNKNAFFFQLKKKKKKISSDFKPGFKRNFLKTVFIILVTYENLSEFVCNIEKEHLIMKILVSCLSKT